MPTLLLDAIPTFESSVVTREAFETTEETPASQSEPQLKSPPTAEHRWDHVRNITLSQTTLSNDAIVRLLRQHSPGSDLSPMSKRLLNRARWVPNKIMSEPPAPGLDCTTKVAVEAAKSLGEIGGDAAVAGVMSAAQAAEGRPGPQRRLKVLRGATAIRGRGGWTGPR